jgi:hypothetical protein
MIKWGGEGEREKERGRERERERERDDRWGICRDNSIPGKLFTNT